MQPIIELKQIEKKYFTGDSEFYALKGVSLTVKEGDFVAIMGPSGSGKSTLMNIIGCLDVPSKGEFLFMGEDVKKKTKTELARIRRTHLGFVFQSFNLLARTSAYSNVFMPLIYHRNIGEHEAQTLVSNALKSVQLENRMNHKPSQLSGGQQQRVAIARALVNNPRLILADEPTGNLDTKTSIEIMKLFTELNYQGKTIILITHEPDIAEYAKRCIFLRDGQILSEEQKQLSLNQSESI